MNQVHRVTRGYDTHEVAGDLDVFGSDVAADDVERLKHFALGFLDARSSGSAQADAQKRSVDVGENLGSDSRDQNCQQGRRCGEIDQDERPTETQNGAEIPHVKRAQGSEKPFPLLAAMTLLHQPRGEDRNQSAGQKVRSDHRKRNCQGEWHKELTPHADHKERGNEDGQNAEHGQQTRHGSARTRIDHGAGAGDAGQHARVNVLDLHGGLVHQNADRKRESAESHDVDALTGGP